VSQTKVGRRFNPDRYGMIFCPNCSGSGRSFAEAQGVNVCKVCGGFGLIRNEEKKASLIESPLFGNYTNSSSYNSSKGGGG
jgi:DnaJ-class molecular chaperone